MRGTGRLTTANGTGILSKGAFKTSETTRRGSPTILALTGGSFSRCNTRARRVVRTLSMNGGRNFRIALRYATATAVTATTALAGSDRCDGSLIKVTRGRAIVFDTARNRARVVTAGRSILIRRPR